MASTTTLHLTNGTAVIPGMRAAGVEGTIVPWEDALHDGPVPLGLNVAAMCGRRAEFLASCGWGRAETLGRMLAERDGALETAASRLDPAGAESRARVDEIVLWFEFDLYDQLQLLQVLDRLPLDGTPRVTAVADDEYLGLLTPPRLGEIFAARREVTSAERIAARDAWTAFRSPDPRVIIDVLPRVTVLRHMAGALRRHLEQFPSIENGLSRTEQQAMETVAGGIWRAGDVFVRSHLNKEAAFFMGDSTFLAHIAALLRSPRPLLSTPRGRVSLTLDDDLALTDDGVQLLEGKLDRVRVCGIDRWLGGVQLSGTGPVWRWDRERQSVRLC
jgi:hypothetical protein